MKTKIFSAILLVSVCASLLITTAVSSSAAEGLDNYYALMNVCAGKKAVNRAYAQTEATLWDFGNHLTSNTSYGSSYVKLQWYDGDKLDFLQDSVITYSVNAASYYNMDTQERTKYKRGLNNFSSHHVAQSVYNMVS